MKKIALLFTLTLACAGQLYGMDPTSLYELRRTGAENIRELPRDVRQEIINTALATSTNIDDTIAMIKKLSTSFGTRPGKLFGNLEDFTKFVHILADKFKGYYPYDIALSLAKANFATPTANKYIELTFPLINSVMNGDESIETTKRSIQQGADINGKAMVYSSLIAFLLYEKPSMKTIKLLLDQGAYVPYFKSSSVTNTITISQCITAETCRV